MQPRSDRHTHTHTHTHTDARDHNRFASSMTHAKCNNDMLIQNSFGTGTPYYKTCKHMHIPPRLPTHLHITVDHSNKFELQIIVLLNLISSSFSCSFLSTCNKTRTAKSLKQVQKLGNMVLLSTSFCITEELCNFHFCIALLRLRERLRSIVMSRPICL